VTESVYCPTCEKNTEILEISMGTRGAETALRCSKCGTIISQKKEESIGKARAGTQIVSAGYTSAHADIISEAFIRNGYAEDIINFANGNAFLTEITRLLREKVPPKLVLIEVAMPIMNGINAALCMRSIEKGIGKDKIPILYFTQKELDDPFVRAIKFLNPAKYVPAPPKVDNDIYQQRVDQLIELLKKEGW